MPSPPTFGDPTTPNLADFRIFLSVSVEVPVSALSLLSPWPQYALDAAIGLTPVLVGAASILYVLAVYNGATHLLLGMCPDEQGQTFFADARGTGSGGFSLITPSTGLVKGASDQGTSSTLEAPQWAKSMTVQQMQAMKTPWGRAWLEWLQAAGPTVIGLS